MKPTTTIARDLNDLFRDGELDLEAVGDAAVPRLPIAEAEDMWLAEIARAPGHYEVSKVTERHLGAEGKLLLAAVLALHRAKLPIDKKTLAGEVALEAIRTTWASWQKRGDPPDLSGRTLAKRMRVLTPESTLAFAEDTLIRSYGEERYARALVKAQEIARTSGSEAASEFMRGVEARIQAASVGTRWKKANDLGRALVTELRDKLVAGDTSFITTGYSVLDAATKGWRRRRMTAIGGWPGHGKSTLMLQLFTAMALSGRRPAYISLEDEAAIAIMRVVMHRLQDVGAAKRLSTLTPDRVACEGYRRSDVDALERFVAETIDKMDLWIDDDGPWSKEKVRASIIAAGRSGCEVVFVDYVQACPRPGNTEPGPHYTACISEWKDAARTANVHLVVGTQLRRAAGRASERDASKVRPSIDEAYYCPAIEQASEYVLLCHRYQKDDEAMGKGKSRPVEDARIIIAKAKDGGVRTVECQWDNDRQMYLIA